MNSPVTICSILQPQNNRHFKYPIFSFTFPHIWGKKWRGEVVCSKEYTIWNDTGLGFNSLADSYSNLGPVNLTLPVPHCSSKTKGLTRTIWKDDWKDNIKKLWVDVYAWWLAVASGGGCRSYSSRPAAVVLVTGGGSVKSSGENSPGSVFSSSSGTKSSVTLDKQASFTPWVLGLT